MNEWMNDRLSLFTQTCMNTEGRRRNAYNNNYSGIFLNIYICFTTDYITDGSHCRQMWITFIKPLDPKIVLPHRCQNMTPINGTRPQCPYIMLSIYIMHFINSPELCIKRRTLALCFQLLGYWDRHYFYCCLIY